MIAASDAVVKLVATDAEEFGDCESGLATQEVISTFLNAAGAEIADNFRVMPVTGSADSILRMTLLLDESEGCETAAGVGSRIENDETAA